MTSNTQISADQTNISAGAVRIQLLDQNLQLHPLKAIYWENAQSLLMADLHLGKAGHFRKAGIRVPLGVSHTNFDRMINLLLEYKPKRVIILGDLFHSDYNLAWEELAALIRQFKEVAFQLVPGNHDILDQDRYLSADLQILSTEWIEGPFLLSHFPLETQSEHGYNLAGHIHPSVRLYGKGQQSLQLPCFYFGATGAILPAFGAFTGTATIPIKKNEQVFVITHTEVIAV